DDIRKDGKIRMVQQKTGDPQISQLGVHALRSIVAIAEPRRDIILDWPFSKQTLHNDFRKLVNTAGLRGTPKWLRRSAATHVESVQPGMAQRLLGHRTAAMARKHYIDPCQLETVAVPQSIPTT